MFEVTIAEQLDQQGKPRSVTKAFRKADDGSITKSKAASDTLSNGLLRRTKIDSLQAFADLIGTMPDNQTLILGVVADNPGIQTFRLTTVSFADPEAKPPAIARTKETMTFRPGKPALALIDFDCRGWADAQAKRFDHDFGNDMTRCLRYLLPEYRDGFAAVARKSASAAVRKCGQPVPAGVSGWHVYLAVTDGSRARDLLVLLHRRAWLAGMGWILPSESGAALERSPIDQMVSYPFSICYEADPVCGDGLELDPHARKPVVLDGPLIDVSTLRTPDEAKYLAAVAQAKDGVSRRLCLMISGCAQPLHV